MTEPDVAGRGVRCRIAPAPTGYLHVGNARTALYNWLFARNQGGTFILRVEDTDRKRSTEEAIGIVTESLRWLDIPWDEGPEVGGDYGPYRQTERLSVYEETADRFLQEGRAYFCYCTPEELEDRRRAALKRGETPGYDGRCRNLTPAERRAFEAEGRPRAVRFAMSGQDITVRDLIRGETHFPANDLRDFVIMRSDGTPTYLLAAAVDDVKMEMTHVIRGEDLLPSTPRQLEIIQAMGAEPPSYAHLPLIVGPDRQPLSKRHGSVAVEWFREQGFLPEALVNYLALLGWSYDETSTFFTRDELVEKFELSRVSRNPAAFDDEKLRWMNGHYIRETDDARLTELLVQALFQEGLEGDLQTVAAAIPLLKTRMHTLKEGVDLIRFLFLEEVEPDEKARKMLGPERAEYLREVATRLESLKEWSHQEIEAALRGLKAERGLSSTQAFQPVRAAVTGTLVSPPLFESIELLGPERTLARLNNASGDGEPQVEI
ncbi:MAG TPA: glutamate--tRNA ligase [Actinomycetota bacterium]